MTVKGEEELMREMDFSFNFLQQISWEVLEPA
jgi:hypothetical protein